jgi:hypothetical protein
MGGNYSLGQENVLMVEVIQKGTTINIRSVFQTPKKLHRTIQNKRCGMLIPGVAFLHDNERPHSAAHTRAF